MRKVLFLFGQLNDGDVEWMRRTGKRVLFRPAEVLIEQGRELHSIFLVLSGTVTVAVGGAVVARLGSGEIVGEMSFVDARPPSATVAAETNVLALDLSRAAVSDRLAENSPFAARFYRAIAIFLSDRLRATEAKQAMADGLPGAPDGQLDDNVLDAMSDAGLRYDRLVRMLIQDGGYHA